MNYLLDTNICIFYLNGRFDIKDKVKKAGKQNCYISEITVAELKFGAEKSEHKEANRVIMSEFISEMQIVPIFSSLDLYATEKARLSKAGTIIDDFDLLIGVSSIINNMIMVTNNTKHFERIEQIELEDWTK
jgi:tRNA(fMet)-specific endonuclease VapC